MMRIGLAALSVLVVGCGDEGNMFPVGGGGNDGGLNPLPDASLVDARMIDASTVDAAPLPVDAAVFIGRVCLATDPRKLNTCADTGAGGLTVRLGSSTAVTADDGSFTIQAGTGTWVVTGTNIVTSQMVLADYEIPAIQRTTYDAMIATNLGGLVPNPGEGAVMVQVIRNGIGLSGATASSAPPSAWQPFYDNPSSPTDWNQLGDANGTVGTGADGAIWLAGIDPGSASVSVSHPGAAQPITRAGLPIASGAITFTTVIFP